MTGAAVMFLQQLWSLLSLKRLLGLNFCLVSLRRLDLINTKSFLFLSKGAEEGQIFPLLPRQSKLFLIKCLTNYGFLFHYKVAPSEKRKKKKLNYS